MAAAAIQHPHLPQKPAQAQAADSSGPVPSRDFGSSAGGPCGVLNVARTFSAVSVFAGGGCSFFPDFGS